MKSVVTFIIILLLETMFGDFNFDGVPGQPGQPKAKKAKINNEAYYELLGIKNTATENEVKKAYRKKALRAHPDKGGDPEKFKEISKAHEILMDPQKRAAYDRYGEAAFEKGTGA